ncbi:DUF1684 domain-containing protein [Actinotalea fermentans]|uniref:DUF1684 domain-containing protein n=1 Tax=Actinotalea fermentans TaxID=43671 RepID=A0A511YX38_9CELL|nr:DUF1684 domain-containing protein [Actinotalea fermentans]KGM16256.1 hypothetical protein N867_01930 [Actinotalea fermentans ATCC 43279 = JCM 9966 = DSM 3133]GEN79774.1 hypothetical protein AFE02nite_15080 [Actinotalea fermentans]
MDRWDVLDWRRRVADLYARVRAAREPAGAHAVWAAGRDALIRTHPASPLPPGVRERFPGTRVAPYAPAFRFVVSVADAPPATRALPAGDDGQVALERVGRVALPGLGELDVWWVGGYGGGLFLPVRDATSGAATYGGGRYVLDTVKGADLGGGREALVVDLNFAYQPSCAYHPSWVCPLPASGNTLAAAVPVGELAA